MSENAIKKYIYLKKKAKKCEIRIGRLDWIAFLATENISPEAFWKKKKCENHQQYIRALLNRYSIPNVVTFMREYYILFRTVIGALCEGFNLVSYIAERASAPLSFNFSSSDIFFFKTSYSISNVSISRCHDEWIMVREIRIRTCHCGERACCNGFSLDHTTPFLSPVSRSFRILTSLPIAVSVWYPFSVRFPLYGPLLRSIRTARVISI